MQQQHFCRNMMHFKKFQANGVHRFLQLLQAGFAANNPLDQDMKFYDVDSTSIFFAPNFLPPKKKNRSQTTKHIFPAYIYQLVILTHLKTPSFGVKIKNLLTIHSKKHFSSPFVTSIVPLSPWKWHVFFGCCRMQRGWRPYLKLQKKN